MNDFDGFFSTEAFKRVYGFPNNKTIYDVDNNKLYGFSYNVGNGWISKVDKWLSLIKLWHKIADKDEENNTGGSFAFFMLDDKRRPNAIISRMREKPTARNRCPNVLEHLTIVCKADVAPLVFQV